MWPNRVSITVNREHRTGPDTEWRTRRPWRGWCCLAVTSPSSVRHAHAYVRGVTSLSKKNTIILMCYMMSLLGSTTLFTVFWFFTLLSGPALYFVWTVVVIRLDHMMNYSNFSRMTWNDVTRVWRTDDGDVTARQHHPLHSLLVLHSTVRSGPVLSVDGDAHPIRSHDSLL